MPEAHTIVAGRPASTRDSRATGGLSLVVAFLTLLVIGTDLFVVSPLLTAIAHRFAVSPGTAGSTVTVFAAVYLVGAPVFGTLADRVGRRTVLVVGLCGFAAGNLLTGLAPSFAIVLVARAVTGIAAAAVSPSLYALVGQTAPPHRRGAWLATALAGLLVSLATGAPSGTALASALGWQAVFVTLGLAAVVCTVANAVVWPPRDRITAGGTTVPSGTITDRLRAVSVTLLWGFAVYSMYTYLGVALRSVAGLSSGRIAVALIVFGSCAVMGSLGGGRVADRYGAGRVATVSLCLVAVLQLVLDLAIRAPFGLLLAALGLFALCAFPCAPAYQSWLVTRFPARAGAMLAWNSSALFLGIALGAASVALLSSFGFRAVPIVAAAGAVLGVLCCVRRPR